jgi:viroplasmin and RNaseH domain-containing protein
MDKKYIVSYNGEIKLFDNWPDCKSFTDNKKCFFKKVTSEKEIEDFTEKYKGKSPKSIYVAVFENEAHQFTEWKECKAFVDEHAGTKFKGFSDLSEAQSFINLNVSKPVELNLPDVLYCYVDGSYNAGTGTYGSGWLAVRNGKVIHTEKEQGANQSLSEMHQIFGELNAAVKAVVWAVQQGEERVVIVYDYEGVKMFSDGSWKAKKDATIQYYQTMMKLRNEINIDFIPIHSHETGERNNANDLNDIADKLAKEAAGVHGSR